MTLINWRISLTHGISLLFFMRYTKKCENWFNIIFIFHFILTEAMQNEEFQSKWNKNLLIEEKRTSCSDDEAVIWYVWVCRI